MSGAARLLAYARPYRGALALSFVAAVAASVLDGLMMALLVPFLHALFDTGTTAPHVVERVVGGLFGAVIAGGDRGTVLRGVVLVIFGTVLVKNACLYASAYTSRRMQEFVAQDLRRDVFGRLLHLPLERYRDTRAGQFITRTVADVDQAKGLASATLVTTMQQAILVAVYLVLLTSLSWRLTTFVLVMAPLVVLAVRPVMRRVRHATRSALEHRGEMTAVVAESVLGVRAVKAYGAQAYESRRLDQAGLGYRDAELRTTRFAELASPLGESIGAAVLVALLLLVAGSVTDSAAMRPEIFLTFTVVALRLLSPVKKLSQFPALAHQSLSAADRVFEIIDAPSDAERDGARSFVGFATAIAFEDVWFAYEPGQWVLSDISFAIEPGEVVAIVGPSGAGKSTLVDLLPRLIEPHRGRVLVDGVPLSEFARASLRRGIGVVGQDTVMFNDTIRANIAYGDEGIPFTSIVAAAEAANAAQFIERLPQGYGTRVGERGLRLSAGERQRIALARALVRDPAVLILDEATSNLDVESERAVQDALERLIGHRTIIVVAHRLSTAARADKIVVIEHGRLVEMGRHDELVAANGAYGRLVAASAD